MALRYSWNKIFKMVTIRGFQFVNLCFMLTWHCWSQNSHQDTKLYWNQMNRPSGWDIANLQYNHFQNGGRPPCCIFEICNFDYVTCLCIWFGFVPPNFALIGQRGAEIWQKKFLRKASVCCLRFVKFCFMVTWHSRSQNSHQHAKLHRNRMNSGWDIAR